MISMDFPKCPPNFTLAKKIPSRLSYQSLIWHPPPVPVWKYPNWPNCPWLRRTNSAGNLDFSGIPVPNYPGVVVVVVWNYETRQKNTGKPTWNRPDPTRLSPITRSRMAIIIHIMTWNRHEILSYECVCIYIYACIYIGRKVPVNRLVSSGLLYQ